MGKPSGNSKLMGVSGSLPFLSDLRVAGAIVIGVCMEGREVQEEVITRMMRVLLAECLE